MTTPPFEQAVCFFHTADLAATDRFYREQLGLPLALDQGACRIYQVSRDGFVGFCTHREPAATDGVIITLATSDVEAMAERRVDPRSPGWLDCTAARSRSILGHISFEWEVLSSKICSLHKSSKFARFKPFDFFHDLAPRLS